MRTFSFVLRLCLQETIEKELRRWKGNWVDLWDEEAVAADAVPPAPSAGAQEGAMVWEYFHDQHWYAYGHASTAALDAARRAGERTALLEPWGAMNRESKTYCVDLENMLQTQMQTRTARESTGEPHGLSDTSTLKTPPPPLPPPPPSPPPVEEGPRASLSALPTFLSTPPPLVMPRPVRCVPAHSLGNAEAPRLALARRNVCLQPPAWAPNVDVELELSGAADPAEMLDFSSAVKAVAFAPDGSCVAAGCHDGQIRTVRLNTQERNLAGIWVVSAHMCERKMRARFPNAQRRRGVVLCCTPVMDNPSWCRGQCALTPCGSPFASGAYVLVNSCVCSMHGAAPATRGRGSMAARMRQGGRGRDAGELYDGVAG